jgi:heme-degrading monooxygenase HmoA
MAVTVVGRWHVPAGQQELAIAAARHELDVRAAQPTARRAAHVFQASDDPSLVLYVAEWSERAAFELYRGQSGPSTLEAAFSGNGEYIICERLLLYGNFAYRAEIVACAIVEAPPEAAEVVRELLLPGGRWVIHGWPGLVHYAVYREIGHVNRYVSVHGWRSEAALRAFRDARGAAGQEAFGSVGATLIPFTGRERASTDLL